MVDVVRESVALLDVSMGCSGVVLGRGRARLTHADGDDGTRRHCEGVHLRRVHTEPNVALAPTSVQRRPGRSLRARCSVPPRRHRAREHLRVGRANLRPRAHTRRARGGGRLVFVRLYVQEPSTRLAWLRNSVDTAPRPGHLFAGLGRETTTLPLRSMKTTRPRCGAHRASLARIPCRARNVVIRSRRCSTQTACRVTHSAKTASRATRCAAGGSTPRLSSPSGRRLRCWQLVACTAPWCARHGAKRLRSW